METVFAIVLGVLALVISLIALVVHFVERSAIREAKMERLQAGIEQFRESADRMLENSKMLLNTWDQISAGQLMAPDLGTLLANQWEFVVKTFQNRYQKHDICRRIVARYVPANGTLLLDSGSSVDLVTFELLHRHSGDLNVFSNNLFAAMHLIGTKVVTFHLLGGRFSNRFAATYSDESTAKIADLGINVFMLAATALRFDRGIMVHRGDNDNRSFKASVLRAFAGQPQTTLIIAVDHTKFIQPTDNHQTVVDEIEWTQICTDHASRIVLVTTLPPEAMQSAERDAILEQINLFKDAGVTVDLGRNGDSGQTGGGTTSIGPARKKRVSKKSK